ncbi:50S ribosomal protein L11 methyltransferase [Elioraea rosea]|uniref:50S ribosomal protein L11 methyltransferase n=1 Tax=Elioraea rosea TaxID=2492390 RepID=UPI0011835C86|nr:50S ribosomal protein L11 methyltransferase [Elioraea rosea]
MTAPALPRLFVTVPEHAVPAFTAAFESACEGVAIFRADDDPHAAAPDWTVEGLLREPGNRAALEGALALAAAVSGIAQPALAEDAVEAEGWLARTREAFPPQPIGRRFLIRGTHDAEATMPGRLALTIDAGLAFGSGEHATTRGCLMALERLPRPRGWMADIGTGSGVLALAAAALWHVRAIGVEIDPWAARVAAENARLNRLHRLARLVHGNGWKAPAIRRHAPYGLVTANILARPLCAMAADLARNLAPGGHAVLSGLLVDQAQMVLAAHRRAGLALAGRIDIGHWATLILRKR